MTLGWNVVGVVILAIAALRARSVALAGSGWIRSSRSLHLLLSSGVVVWRLTDTGGERERTAMRVIGGAFIALAIYIAAQTVYLLATGVRSPRRSASPGRP